jgi:hypothetical protein
MKWLTFFLLICIACNKPQAKDVCIDKPVTVFKNWSINSKPKHLWTDTDWLAKMIMTEVSDSNDLESMYLVGAVAINHTTLFGYTLQEALLRPKAFSGLNREGYHWWKMEPTTTHKKIAIELITNGVSDKACNVFAFCNMSLISKQTHNWFNSFKLYKKIGQVSFFSYEKIVSLP